MFLSDVDPVVLVAGCRSGIVINLKFVAGGCIQYTYFFVCGIFVISSGSCLVCTENFDLTLGSIRTSGMADLADQRPLNVYFMSVYSYQAIGNFKMDHLDIIAQLVLAS